MTLSVHAVLRLGALDLDVEFDVRPGELVAVLGPNGAGKSTLLRAVAGLQPLDRGHVTVDDRVLDDGDGVFVEPEQRPIGVVFQQYLLFEHMSVLENVAFGLRARGVAKGDARSRARAWIDRLGLSEHAAARPRQLSGGQSQRTALARAMATDPRVLLLDEPLAALDVGTRATVRRDLRQHLATFEGMRVLVTHDPVDAWALADRVVIVENGRVVQHGTLTEVTARPRSRYVADLVGVNLVSGEVRDGVLHTPSGAAVVIADADAGPALAVIRPHSVVLTREVPSSSARNVWPGTIVDLDRLGERVRVVLGGTLPLTAEITVASMESLSLRPGDEVFAAVKATDIDVAPA